MRQATPAIYAVLVLCILLAPATAHAAQDCEAPTWDEATKTVTQHIGVGAEHTKISPGFYNGEFSACLTEFPGARRIVIQSDKHLDIELTSNTARNLVAAGPDEVKLDLSYTDASFEPKIELFFTSVKAEFGIDPRILADGIDLNADGDTDIILQTRTVKSLSIRLPTSNLPVIIDTRNTTITYRTISIRSSQNRQTPKYHLANPTGTINASGTKHSDQFTIIAHTANIQGNGGNDIINARHVTHGGTYTGGNGNDRLLLGPGPDIISARRGSDGNDHYDTGAGNDRIFNTGGSDTIITGAGNDQVTTIAATGETMKVNTGPGNDTFADFSSAKPGKTTANLGTGNDRALIFGKPSLHWLATTINCGLGQDHVYALGTNPRNRGCESTTR